MQPRTKIIVILFIVIVTAIFVAMLTYSKKCDIEDCFIDRANSCKPTTFRDNTTGLMIEYKIAKGCMLMKTVESVPDGLPEIMYVLRGKNMRCHYEKNNFQKEHLLTLKGVLENCEGELKDAIALIESPQVSSDLFLTSDYDTEGTCAFCD